MINKLWIVLVLFSSNSLSWANETASPQTLKVYVNSDPSLDTDNFDNKIKIMTSNLTLQFESNGTSYYCSLDGQALVNCTSPFPLNDLSIGNHRFHIRDNKGNEKDLSIEFGSPFGDENIGIE